MRRVIASEALTLDGSFAGPRGEIDWQVLDDDFNEYSRQLLDGAGALLFGRATYELMAAFWPTPAGEAYDPHIAERMNALPKLVATRAPLSVEWRHASRIEGDVASRVAALKRESGKDVLVLGSGELVGSLAGLGLIDEFRLVLTPVAIGGGRSLFARLGRHIRLDFLEARPFPSGNVLLRYRPSAEGEGARDTHTPSRITGRDPMDQTTGKTLRIERTYDCSPEILWEAWTDPKQYAKWFNPFPGTDAEVLEWDLRVGGRVKFNMVTTDGEKYPNEGEFLVLDKPRELVTGEADGMRMRVTFHPEGKRTRMVMEQTGLPMEVDLDQARGGWGAILDKLQVHVINQEVRATGADLDANAKGFTIERTFRAAPAKVWEMWTTKEGLMQWWAPSAEEMGYRFAVLKLDVRVGGEYAFEMANDAHSLVNRGTYRLVEPHAKIAWTWHYDIFLAPGEKPYDVPISVELHEAPDGTRMVFTQGPLASPEFTEGSRQGVLANFDKLAKALGG